MRFDHRRLRTGERLVAVVAVLLFIDLFLTWYSVDVGGRAGGVSAGLSLNLSAWQAYGVLDLVLLLVIIIGLAHVALTGTQEAPALPVASSVIVTVLGALATLLVLYRIINQPGDNALLNVEYGAYVGLGLCAGLAYGGFLCLRDERTHVGDADPTTGSSAPPPA